MLRRPVRERRWPHRSWTARVGGLSMARAFHHFAFRIHRRLIQPESSLRVHNAVILAIADQHWAFDAIGSTLHVVFRELLPGVRQIARSDDPAHPLLDRRIVIK